VTVKYGLHTKDPDEVIEKLSGQPPLRVTLGATSVFYAPEYVVLKLAVHGRSLVRLNQFICQNFECTDTHPDYKPHATIAYLVKDPKDPYYFHEFYTTAFNGVEMELDTVEFSTSDGKKVQVPLTGEAMIEPDEVRMARKLLGLAKELIGES
jgi:hypothetical protein